AARRGGEGRGVVGGGRVEPAAQGEGGGPGGAKRRLRPPWRSRDVVVLKDRDRAAERPDLLDDLAHRSEAVGASVEGRDRAEVAVVRAAAGRLQELEVRPDELASP